MHLDKVMSEMLEQFNSAERIYRLTFKSTLLKLTFKRSKPKEVWDFEIDSPEEDTIGSPEECTVDSIETSLKNTSISDSRLQETKNHLDRYVYLSTMKRVAPKTRFGH